jgi:hypothetical protein
MIFLTKLEEVRVRICEHNCPDGHFYVETGEDSDVVLMRRALDIAKTRQRSSITDNYGQRSYVRTHHVLEVIYRTGPEGKDILVSLHQNEIVVSRLIKS